VGVEERLSDAPRSGSPGIFSAEQIVEIEPRLVITAQQGFFLQIIEHFLDFQFALPTRMLPVAQ
jgi:hypothetical protein